jgi:hypothetical protein
VLGIAGLVLLALSFPYSVLYTVVHAPFPTVDNP